MADDAFLERSVTVLQDGEPQPFRYRLLRPARPEPGRTYPVVLFLHGSGERGSDNAAQLKFLPTWLAEPALQARHPCLVIAPQCRTDHKWVETPWQDPRGAPQPAEPSVDLAAAVAALDAVLAAEPADPDRVLLTGLSMGGYGTWDLASRSPERFAAALPICGGGDAATAPRLVTLPIWAFHGADDRVVPPERSRAMVEAIRTAGGAPKYTEFPRVGHDSWTPAYREPAVLDWFFAQRRER